jgi:outer membrane protein assembly factor BamA
VAEACAAGSLTVRGLSVAPSQQAWLDEAGVQLSRFVGKPVNQQLLQGVLRKFVAYHEDHGYPFARAQFDSVRMDAGGFSAVLRLSRGNRIAIDTLLVKGEGRVRPAFMRSYLRLRKPRLYSEAYVRDIDRRINALGFVSVLQPSAVEFRSHSAKLYAYAGQGRANRASGLLAFAYGEDERLALSGEASLLAANLFGGGEQLAIDWSSPGAGAQLLRVQAQAPYLVLGAVGLLAALDMERRDTLFMRFGLRLGLSAPVGADGTASLFVERQEHSSAAPEAGAQLTLYGLGLLLRRLDSPLFPRRGYSLDLALSTGSRRTTSPAGSAESLAVEASAEALRHAPLSPRTGLLLRLQAKARGALSAGRSAPLLPSERYSVGGAATMRGFGERSIFTPAYAIATLEPRFFYSAQGYLHAFYDYAALGSAEGALRQLHSAGVGVCFATGAGVFSFAYAMGREDGWPLLLKGAKVHVSYVAVF